MSEVQPRLSSSEIVFKRQGDMRLLEMELPGRRTKKRHQRMDGVKEVLKLIGLRAEKAGESVSWSLTVGCTQQPKEDVTAFI